MKVFHFLTVKPVQVEWHEVPRVAHGDYLVRALDMQSAFAKIEKWDFVVEASEVWGRQFPEDAAVLATPKSVNLQEVELAQHRHWSRVQDDYTLVKKGEETPEEFFDRKWAIGFAQRYPSTAAKMGISHAAG